MSRFATLAAAATSVLALFSAATPAPTPAPWAPSVTVGSTVLAGGTRIGGSWCC